MDEVKDVFRALNTLPKEEARVVYKRLGVIPSDDSVVDRKKGRVQTDRQKS